MVPLLVLAAACSAEDPIATAADEICAEIDAEPDDLAALEGYERAVARERRSGLDEQELAAALTERCGRAIAAIIAAGEEVAPDPASESSHSSEPEPEAEPEFVDLRELDWAEQVWATTCAIDDDFELADSPLQVRLEADTAGESFGWFHAHPEAPVPRYEVDIAEVTYRDITGDGTDEAVFQAACIPGNVVQPIFVVWAIVDEQPEQLPEVRLGSDRPVLVDSFDAFEGTLRVFSREPAPGSAPSDGHPIEVTTDWTFDGTGWSPQEISRVDTRPPPEPPSATPTECAAGNASAQDAALCLVAAANADDYALAATVASPEAIEFVRETRAWGPIEWEFNGCSETCWFYEPSRNPEYHGVGIEMWIGRRDGGIIIEWIDAYG